MDSESEQAFLPHELSELAGQHMHLDFAPLTKLGPVDEHKPISCIVETPSGSRTKFKYDKQSGLFELDKTLPMGIAFPFDFGFIPRTLAEDGDPLDVMIMLDQPAFPGVLVRTRIMGVLEAEQTERDGRTIRNDRLLAVHHKSILWENIRHVNDLAEKVCYNVEHFFANYNQLSGKHFRSLGWFGADKAYSIIEAAIDNYNHGKKHRKPS
jgi:inorganic pyrophosphatase